MKMKTNRYKKYIYIIKDRHKNKPSKKKDGQKDRQTDK